MNLFGVSIGEGNGKVGDVYTFSLPSRLTCPGASTWCRKHCYAYRYERHRPACQRAYQRNHVLAKNPEEFVRIMTGALPRLMPCMRIHVAGDFMSVAYVEAWIEVCKAYPQTRFWAYTRSWNVSELLEPLERLRLLPNMELFGSIDPTMPLPPEGWRVAFIEIDPRAKGILCKEQTKQHPSCLECGYCFRAHSGNVIFKVH